MIIASFDIGEKNLAYVVGTINNLIDMKLINVKKRKYQTIPESCELISEELKSRNWIDCDRILIERQMKSNVRCQRISQHVWTWFRVSYPSIPVSYISPILKTKNSKEPMNYVRRKKWAIEETKKSLIDDKMYLEKFLALPKKDDVADAYLQMMMVLKQN